MCIPIFKYIYTVIILCIDITISMYRHLSKTYIDIKNKYVYTFISN